VSCAELTPGRTAQYVRSPGTKAKIIKFDKEEQLVLLELPSDNKKTFSFFSFVLLDKISLSLHSRCANTKSGY
jgi:ribosomal protein L2